MQIDVGAYIADLLYEYDSVNVPGLGGFQSRYQPADIDQVQGKLHPPSKRLDFNENLVVDDGLLVNYIKEKHQLTYAEAERAVEEYVRGVKAAIEKREIVVFPRVGRLYKDYENKVQFLPDNTNFNTEAFGLPTVQFYPVSHGQKTAAAATGSASTATVSGQSGQSTSAAIADWFQSYLPYIAAVSIIIVGIGIFLFLRDRGGAEAGKEEIPASRINKKPSMEESGDDVASLDDPEDINDMENEAADPNPLDTEGSTPRPGQKYAIIAIGLFGNEANVNNLTEKIFKAGYQAYTEQAGRLTRVGVRVNYSSERELDRVLEDVRNQFDSDAFVFQRRVE